MGLVEESGFIINEIPQKKALRVVPDIYDIRDFYPSPYRQLMYSAEWAEEMLRYFRIDQARNMISLHQAFRRANQAPISSPPSSIFKPTTTASQPFPSATPQPLTSPKVIDSPPTKKNVMNRRDWLKLTILSLAGAAIGGWAAIEWISRMRELEIEVGQYYLSRDELESLYNSNDISAEAQEIILEMLKILPESYDTIIPAPAEIAPHGPQAAQETAVGFEPRVFEGQVGFLEAAYPMYRQLLGRTSWGEEVAVPVTEREMRQGINLANKKTLVSGDSFVEPFGVAYTESAGPLMTEAETVLNAGVIGNGTAEQFYRVSKILNVAEAQGMNTADMVWLHFIHPNDLVNDAVF